MTRDLGVFSDYEFEQLCGDLLGAEFGRTFERFSRGPDGGIDLRTYDHGLEIAQCKHYRKSSYEKLLADLGKELAKVKAINPKLYRVATSQELTPGRKQKIFNLFEPWMPDPSFVLGAHDIDALLTKHPSIERRYVKLWLSSGLVLDTAVHSGIYERSSSLVDEISSALPRYVEGDAFPKALKVLDEHNVCLIAGPPGIGKTTLARMLLAHSMKHGYQLVEISEDVEEAWEVYKAGERQAFYYDDFLGRISFGERLGKNEDHRLASFIAKVSTTDAKICILTTREYILEDARHTYEELGRLDDRLKFVLHLEHYSRLDRARILYNHLWHANLKRADLDSLLSERRYMQIVDHPNFNPRLIEYITRPPILA